MTVLGTRPEVIKLAPVVRALEADDTFNSVVCATAQHREMLDLALGVFGIVPTIDLDLMRPDQRVHEVTGRVLDALTPVLEQVAPDMVLVQGDTTTAMAAALACFYKYIPVGHVEAGLRTGDLANPFPEEMNRRAIGIFATLHFAPTPRSRDALLSEGVAPDRVVMTGNTVIDALHLVLAADRPTPSRRCILVTAHRRESFGTPFEDLCKGLRQLALRNPDVEILYPVHPNPQVQRPVNRLLAGLPNVKLVTPMSYQDFVLAMHDSYLIITDSGGIQEEAPSLGKPVLVMRDTTERPEAVEVGASLLVGTDPQRIVREAERLLNDDQAYRAMAEVENPFGDGHASERIVASIARLLSAS